MTETGRIRIYPASREQMEHISEICVSRGLRRKILKSDTEF